MALNYVAGRHGLQIKTDKRERLVMAWDTMRPWQKANEVIEMIKGQRHTNSDPVKR